MAQLCVAYVLLRFPRLSETFVAEEIRSIKKKGVSLRIFSLLRNEDELIHPVSQELLADVQYAPGLLSGSLWLAQGYFLVKAPAKYIALLAATLSQPAPRPSSLLKRIAIFLKGAWIARQLEGRGVELVHTHFAWLSAIAAMVMGRLLDIPFTCTAHAYDIYWSEKNDLLRLTSSVAERVITISDANKKAILKNNPGVPEEKVSVIHCGIDLECFQPPPARPIDSVVQITSVGRLRAKKGHETLIRACAKLQSQNVDFQCVIMGSGELEQPLKALISELKLNNRVTLAGATSQDWVRERLGRSDVFVLACVTEESGDRDGIPVSIMEAMAMGVPVISTPVSGIPELVRHEETGLLVTERNASELASAIERLAADEELRHRVAQNALNLICREYDINRNTAELRSLFEEAVYAKKQMI